MTASVPSRTGPPVAAAPLQDPPSGRAARPLIRAVLRLEEDERVDRAAPALDHVARRLLRSPAVADDLRGSWAGHALHPLLTDFPLGAWMAASFLDLFGGRHARRAAQRLVGFGLLAAVPTAAAGVAEWQATGGRTRRVGVVHAGLNGAATTVYTSSWIARRRGAHRVGVALALFAGAVAFVGGYLGGHLSLVRKIGTAHPDFGDAAVASYQATSPPLKADGGGVPGGAATPVSAGIGPPPSSREESSP